MRPLILALILALAAAPALAFDTYAFPRGIVSVGDSTAALQQRGGRPDRIVTLENRRGAAVGERWEYHLPGKQVNFTVTDGRVTRVEELR
jgi:hypothetical protein